MYKKSKVLSVQFCNTVYKIILLLVLKIKINGRRVFDEKRRRTDVKENIKNISLSTSQYEKKAVHLALKLHSSSTFKTCERGLLTRLQLHTFSYSLAINYGVKTSNPSVCTMHVISRAPHYDYSCMSLDAWKLLFVSEP